MTERARKDRIRAAKEQAKQSTPVEEKGKAKADSKPQTKSEEQIALEIAIKNDESRLQENRRRLEELIRREKEEAAANHNDHDDDAVCAYAIAFRYWNHGRLKYVGRDDIEKVVKSPSPAYEEVYVLIEGKIIREVSEDELEKYGLLESE